NLPPVQVGNAALVAGEQVAFGASAGFALLGLIAALLLLPRSGVSRAPSGDLDPEPGRRTDPAASPCG
ncbi:MAG TPA: hypothetical protein VGP05_23315, partial [Pseudonocardia sp.]|nr:hypothetical protein [Pseudonocardia sp.]